jgi:thymidylate kinase
MQNPQRFRIIDANQPIEKVKQTVENVIATL